MQRSLSRREEQVLELVEMGLSNKVIGHSLGISLSAVSTLLDRARRKVHRCCCSPALPENARDATGAASAIADVANAPYFSRVPNLRIPRDAKARVTRIGEHLVLVSVPIASAPEVPAARALTPAEKAVVDLALSGLSNAAIARKRRCATRTVVNQLASAYKKLGVGSRRELRVKSGR